MWIGHKGIKDGRLQTGMQNRSVYDKVSSRFGVLLLHFNMYGNVFYIDYWLFLMDVVKEDGDAAFSRLSLTWWLFHDVVCKASFRKEAHFAWLDSVVNWSAYSSDYKEMYRRPYLL
ncbi:hypothetical protein QQF64_019966 [Cirrhinus molitorella]|uniref:Uncharacterized protein n=1 Tax=Cirrhinus molitorella TaxID=172907 RepID=A0ABR3LH30_9TELE